MVVANCFWQMLWQNLPVAGLKFAGGIDVEQVVNRDAAPQPRSAAGRRGGGRRCRRRTGRSAYLQLLHASLPTNLANPFCTRLIVFNNV